MVCLSHFVVSTILPVAELQAWRSKDSYQLVSDVVFLRVSTSTADLLNSVLNVEEGAEYTVRNGDAHAERNLNEYGTDTEPYAPAGRINRECKCTPRSRQPHTAANMESQYDYGSRAGIWRIYEAFKGVHQRPICRYTLTHPRSEYKMPLTIYGVAYSVNKVPRMAEVAHAEGWEMASHGCRSVESIIILTYLLSLTTQ